MVFKSRFFNLSPRDLQELGFQTFETLHTKTVGTFVLRFLINRGLMRNIFLLLSAACITGCILWFQYTHLLFVKAKPIVWIFLGMLLFFGWIPIHEGLHVLAYRLAGARDVRLEAHWKQGYFLALAPGFVADARSFLFIAFLPFLIISLAHLALVLYIKAEWVALFWGSFILHTLGCVGDFAAADLFIQNRQWEVVTFDEPSGITYFLKREKNLR